MNKTAGLAGLVGSMAVFAITLGSAIQPQDSLLGRRAPSIVATGSDGKEFKLEEALKKGPVFVYFISTNCPVNDEANKYYERIHQAFKSKAVSVIGIASDDLVGFSKWNQSHKLTFPVICDADYEHIETYKVKSSPTSLLIGPDGRVSRVWVGYSESSLKETVGVIASYLRVDPPSVDFQGAPKSIAVGCAI
ncbi:MAG: TlpA family protein disulfide reductase [Fimbriimonadales bacterium]|nr:TlpA family protein disulfide reductase [Fimbriimonadales bacterium]